MAVANPTQGMESLLIATFPVLQNSLFVDDFVSPNLDHLGVSIMQLTYHGQPYQASFPAVDAVVTGEHGIFLGRPYPFKRFKVASSSPIRTQLTYRGIRYSL